MSHEFAKMLRVKHFNFLKFFRKHWIKCKIELKVHLGKQKMILR